MNVFDTLPLEILKQITLILDRRTIKYMYHVSSTIKKLDLHELLMLRKLVAYPRSTGYSNSYRVAKGINFLDHLIEYFDSIDTDLVKGI